MAVNCARQCGQCFRRFKLGTNFVSLTNVRVAHKYAQADVKPNKFKAVYRDLHGAIEEPSTAKDFVFALSKKERQLLYLELQKFQLDMQDISSTHAPPTGEQLKKVALHNALPFIGFGFLDNFLMILAGEYIEFKFGAMFGISTMAAAALGNWISDLAGVQTAHYVEVVTSKFGVKAPALTPEQVDMSSTRWASNIGKAIGVSIGCILGMFPLLLYEPKEKANPEEEPS
ncbi:transmembrane protein 65-like [Mercenaria mercenaria]|uniref:transmembrane protein 65-like n=1 Tax=Mercenaria mercenaria TaxID=6596 RepID=UPI00234F47A8|nr:transmembrane protein 65-like [Mercenaria mercenaria]